MLMKTGILYFTTCFHGFGILRHVDPFVRMLHTRAYLRGGFRGFKPPPKFSDFFLKSEGKEIERKRKKRDVGGGGGYLLTYFWG